MTKGKVKFFNEQKGWGFITPTNGNSKGDIFVHAKGLVDLIKTGDEVQFDEQKQKDGRLCAVNVTLIK